MKKQGNMSPQKLNNSIINDMKIRQVWRLTPVILATLDEIGKIVVQVHSRQKVHGTAVQTIKLGVVAQTCHPSYCRKSKKEELSSGWPKHIFETLSDI
jgi:pantothenate kinase type III